MAIRSACILYFVSIASPSETCQVPTPSGAKPKGETKSRRQTNMLCWFECTLFLPGHVRWLLLEKCLSCQSVRVSMGKGTLSISARWTGGLVARAGDRYWIAVRFSQGISSAPISAVSSTDSASCTDWLPREGHTLYSICVLHAHVVKTTKEASAEPRVSQSDQRGCVMGISVRCLSGSGEPQGSNGSSESHETSFRLAQLRLSLNSYSGVL